MTTTLGTGTNLSPCVSICKYDDNNYCIGCRRHMTEIFDWLDYDDKMKLAILEDIKERE
jgi:predicted Fe-S protein YdhL (DUF1289 family)